MKQYLPKKPTKRGFKVWVRAEARTGYFSEFEVYTGKTTCDNEVERGLGEKVVLKLAEKLKGQHYQLFYDNFFTTCNLAELLLAQQTYSIGTVRQTRRDFDKPEEISQKNSLVSASNEVSSSFSREVTSQLQYGKTKET